jgi:hypothetical protein
MWKSLEFNLDVGSITLCLVPQLFMHGPVVSWWLLGVCQLRHGYDRWGPIGSTTHSTFLFFTFLVCCMLGEAKVPSQYWLRMLWTPLQDPLQGPLDCRRRRMLVPFGASMQWATHWTQELNLPLMWAGYGFSASWEFRGFDPVFFFGPKFTEKQ